MVEWLLNSYVLDRVPIKILPPNYHNQDTSLWNSYLRSVFDLETWGKLTAEVTQDCSQQTITFEFS